MRHTTTRYDTLYFFNQCEPVKYKIRLLKVQVLKSYGALVVQKVVRVGHFCFPSQNSVKIEMCHLEN